MDWIISLIIGGIIGWVASMLMKTNAQMGVIANVLIGIVGSVLGYWLAGLLGIVSWSPSPARPCSSSSSASSASSTARPHRQGLRAKG